MNNELEKKFFVLAHYFVEIKVFPCWIVNKNRGLHRKKKKKRA